MEVLSFLEASWNSVNIVWNRIDRRTPDAAISAILVGYQKTSLDSCQRKDFFYGLSPWKYYRNVYMIQIENGHKRMYMYVSWGTHFQRCQSAAYKKSFWCFIIFLEQSIRCLTRPKGYHHFQSNSKVHSQINSWFSTQKYCQIHLVYMKVADMAVLTNIFNKTSVFNKSPRHHAYFVFVRVH